MNHFDTYDTVLHGDLLGQFDDLFNQMSKEDINFIFYQYYSEYLDRIIATGLDTAQKKNIVDNKQKEDLHALFNEVIDDEYE